MGNLMGVFLEDRDPLLFQKDNPKLTISEDQADLKILEKLEEFNKIFFLNLLSSMIASRLSSKTLIKTPTRRTHPLHFPKTLFLLPEMLSQHLNHQAVVVTEAIFNHPYQPIPIVRRGKIRTGGIHQTFTTTNFHNREQSTSINLLVKQK